MRWRPITAVVVVLGLTVAGFILARSLAQRDASRESERRIAIAGAQIESQLEVATSLTQSLSQFMVTEGAGGVTNNEFATNVQRWLSPAGIPSAAWAEEVQSTDRAAYERRNRFSIVAPDARRRPEPPNSPYLPMSLVSGLPPMNQRGVDLNREPGIAAALHSAIVPGGVGATPVAVRSDGTRGLFLVAPAPNLIDGVLRPGAVVVFLSETTLRAAARNPAGLRFLPADGSLGDRAGGDTVRDEFAVAGQQFSVVMPKESVSGPGATLPWIILASGLLLAALAGALAVIAMRRARTQQDFDRIFNLSPDLVAVADFDGHFTRVNPAAEQVLGYTPEELLARPYLDLVHPDDRERTAAEAAAIGQGKTTLSFENRLFRKDGSVRVFEWTATSVVEDAVIYGVARDVTERRRADTESARLAAEQSALRRVAELVARQAPPEEVFGLVTDELSLLLEVDMVRTVRFDQDGTGTILAARGVADDRLTEGAKFEIPEGSGIGEVLRTGRPARVAEFGEVKGPVGAALRGSSAVAGAGVAGPIVVGGRLWGAMGVGARNAEALPPGSEHRVAQFAELISTAISNVESRAEVEQLAAEQAALRRVAELVAQQAPAEEVFALVTEELNRLLNVATVGTGRFEPDGTVTIMAVRGTAQDAFPPGTSVALEGGSAIEQVFRTGRPAHVENYDKVGGELGSVMRKLGAGWAAAGPIVVDGRLWGAMTVNSGSAGAYPAGAEQRVAQFAELVSTAISNLESRAKVEQLAAEQTALRRVAELVARQAPAEEVFARVTEELSLLLGARLIRTIRSEPDRSTTVVASLGKDVDLLPPGTSVSWPPGSVADQVLRTGRSARLDDYGTLSGPIAAILREEGVRCAAGGPIIVDGQLWGAMVVASDSAESLPPGSEDRVAEFAELMSTAISNIDSRAKVERLAAEQSALRRVAELVARQGPPEQVFGLVTKELGRLLEVNIVRTVRFEPDGTATVAAAHGITDDRLTRGANFPIPEGSVIKMVLRTGRPARVDDFAEVQGPVGAILREQGAGVGVAGPLVVDGRLWGAMAVGAQSAEALPPGSEARVAQFAELVSTAISNVESRGQVERLAAEQSALRRVAMLVARHAPAEEVFSLVTEELSGLLGVDVVRTIRFEPDGSATVVAATGRHEDRMPPGTNMPIAPGGMLDQVFRTGRPARYEDYSNVGGPTAAVLREEGVRSAVGGPILVDGQLWGAMVAAAQTGASLPPGSVERVAQFAELVSTTISNIESRAKVERLAAEQSALRRVATLVAREFSPEDLFATLVEELGVLLEVDGTAILRFEADSSATVVAGWSDGAITLPIGARLSLEGENLAGQVHRTGSAWREEDYSGAPGMIAATVRELGIRSAVSSPIVVEGATWGVIAVLSRQPESLPSDTEARIAEFTRQAGLAVANAKSRSDLAESRARIVRAGDEARRRFERDLHDGAQQRLVSLGLELRAAEATVPPELDDLRPRLSRLGAGLNDVLENLRELSRGLHPVVLSEGGLSAALSSLARRSAVPVELCLELADERFAEPVEVAVYYVTSEALTNTAKHAHASRAEVIARRREGWLELSVRDDGRGGAEAAGGSGLTGLVDRVEAIGGTIHIDSSANRGTAIDVKLPIESGRN